MIVLMSTNSRIITSIQVSKIECIESEDTFILCINSSHCFLSDWTLKNGPSLILPSCIARNSYDNGFWRVWNLAKKIGKFLYKNLPIYKEKTWQKWSSVDPHCSLVTHSAKGRFKWKNWLFIMPFCHLLSILAAFLIANCDFWLKTTWLTFLKRFMTENWPKQKKSKKVSTRDRTGDLLCGSQMW